MNLLKTLIHGKGFSIEKIDDMSCFEDLRREFIKKIDVGFNGDQIEGVRKRLASMKNYEINETMQKLLSFNRASEMMAVSCKEIIKKLCGEEIYLQRRANIIFNLPGINQRRQWPHYELMSGVSPFTFVLWAPLHDISDEGGVYYLNNLESLEMIKIEHAEGLVNGPTMFNRIYNEKAKKLKFGEVIVFNPFVLHGNIDFTSELARIGCSIRVQSINKPLMQKNSDFFKIYNFS